MTAAAQSPVICSPVLVGWSQGFCSDQLKPADSNGALPVNYKRILLACLGFGSLELTPIPKYNFWPKPQCHLMSSPGDQQVAAFVPSKPKVLLHVVDVGHGLAVLVEIQHDHAGSKFYLYDTGFEKKSRFYATHLKRALANFCASRNDIEKVVLDGIVISHPHCHHYGGLQYLLHQRCLQPTYLVINSSFNHHSLLPNAKCEKLPIDLTSASFTEFNMHIEDLFFNEGSFSFYFHKKFPPTLYTLTPSSDHPEAKNHGGNQNANSSSTLLRIQPSDSSDYPAVLLTGDTPAERVLDIGNNSHLNVLQVPCHSSKHNLPKTLVNCLPSQHQIRSAALLLALYYRRSSLAPAIDKLKENHALKESAEAFKSYFYLKGNAIESSLKMLLQPRSPTSKSELCLSENNFQVQWYRDHCNAMFPKKVVEAVEKEEKQQTKRLTFLRECLGWAYFYQDVKADLYLVSAGNSVYGIPSHEVLNGIIIANMWRSTECRIVLTNNASLQTSLCEVFPREVRETASATTHIWYLNDHQGAHSHNQLQSVNRSFFTIDPWCQQAPDDEQCSSPTIAVNPFSHSVSVKDMNVLRLEDVKDEVDFRNNTSTPTSNTLATNVASKPKLTTSPETDHCLEQYLKLIGYPNPHRPHELSEVLGCLLGIPIITQLCNLTPQQGSKYSEILEVLPSLLTFKTRGMSTFELNHTKTAAIAANIEVYINPKNPIHVAGQMVQAARLEVRNAKTSRMKATLQLQFAKKSHSLEISKYLKLEESCGQTLAEYIASLNCDQSSWLSAQNVSMGEILHILLGDERAICVIQGLPMFLSFHLSEWKMNHYLTTIEMGANHALQEAHIYVRTPIELPPLLNGRIKLCIKTLAIHIFLSHKEDERAIRIEGECMINGKHTIKLSSPSTTKDVKLTLIGSFTAKDIFSFFGINVSPNSLHYPLGEGEELQDGLTYEAGFTLSQMLPSTTAVELSSLFFKVNFQDLHHLLPTSLACIKNLSMLTTIQYPLSTSPKVGLEASFVLNLKTSRGSEKTVLLDCIFSAHSSRSGSDYVYVVNIRPYYRPYEAHEAVQGASVYDIVSALSPRIGEQVTDELLGIPDIGQQILSGVTMKKIALHVSRKEIRAVEVEASVTHLEIFARRMTVHDGNLKLLYSDECLQLECKGKLTFLTKFTYDIELVLPTKAAEGKIHFENYNEEVTLKAVLEGFGWFSKKVTSVPILSSVLNIVVRRLHITFSPSSASQGVQVTGAEFSVFKEELDIGILRFSDIELDVKMRRENDEIKIYFSLNGFIAEALYAQLEYNPDNHLLTGQVFVSCFRKVTAPDALQAFHLDSSNPTSNSFKELCDTLQQHFMDVFNSPDNQQKAGFGLTAFINVSIHVPSRSSERYSLEHVQLEVKDALKVRNCILDTIQFEYSRTPFSDDTTSTARLVAILQKFKSNESMVMNFDLDSKRSVENIVTAKLKRGPQGGFLKLSSILELSGCATPELPDVGLPPIFDLELFGVSLSFTLKPFQVCSFNVAVLIPDWQVFSDPKLRVQNLTLRATWKLGSVPELTFTDSSLTFRMWELIAGGRLSHEKASIECKNALQPQVTKTIPPMQFESLVSDYSPSSLCPVIPKNIGLPSMVIEVIQMKILLQKIRKTFRLNALISTSSTWIINFGNQQLVVEKIGGALEWEKKQDATSSYKAIIYGSMCFCRTNVQVEMVLGNSTDNIIVATVSHLHCGQVADYLLFQRVTSPEKTTFSDLVPSNMRTITPASATMAINITRKQFFLSGSVEGWGDCSLLVGRLQKYESGMDYAVALTLKDGFHFSKLSKSLAFIDEYITLRCVNLLVSSNSLQQLYDIMESYKQTCTQLGDQLKQPFSSLSTLASNKITTEAIESGTTLFAAIDVHACRSSKGAFKNVFQLGDESLAEHDIIVMASICHSSLEFRAFLSRILLFGMLEFSNIRLLYRLSKPHSPNKPSQFIFELSGRVTFDADLISHQISFDGKLCITDATATFEATSACRDEVHRPAGLNFTVRNFKLRLQMDLGSSKARTPDVFISGDTIMGPVHLQARFLLKGAVFKVFHIRLVDGLKLSVLFEQSNVYWSAISLDIGIKEGQFYYAREDIEFTEDGMVCKYDTGYHLEGVITLLNCDFRIRADIPHDRSQLSISGRSVSKINLVFAKLTGTGSYSHEGPELKYANNTLSICAGVEIFQEPWFEGELSYKLDEKALEGSIVYQGRILWIDNPRMKVRWSEKGFEIVEFPILGDLPFNLLGAIAQYAKVLYNLASGLLRWGIELTLTTDTNPDPRKYLVKLVLKGELTITVLGFIKIDLIPLPDIPLRIPKVDNFSFGMLPQYILSCLWESAGDICKSLLSYLNPIELAKLMGKRIINAITGAITSVVNVAKKVAEKTWGFFKRCFGFSAFIVDTESNTMIGYIYAGKGGRKLCDIEYIVNHFGPFLAVHTVGEVAEDVHRNATACIDAEREFEERDLEEQQHTRDQLDQLKRHTQELASNLNLAADEILTVRYIRIEICDGSNLYLEWELSNESGDIVYSGDKGDIDHHLKVTVTTIHKGARLPEVNVETVLEKTWSKEQLKDENEKQEEGQEEQSKIEEQEQGKTEEHHGERQPDKRSDKHKERTEEVKEKKAEEQDKWQAETLLIEKKMEGRRKEQDKGIEEEEERQTERQSGENVKQRDKEEEKQTEKRNGELEVEEQSDEEERQTEKRREELEIEEQSDKEERQAEMRNGENEEQSDKEVDKQTDHQKEKEPQQKEEKRPSTTVPIDPMILQHSVCIDVSIQPTVTLRVMTLPPETSMKVEQEMIDRKDPEWMKRTKKEIKEEGREKEVTLRGRKVCKKHLTKPVLESEVLVTANYAQKGEGVTISGTVAPMMEAQSYLIQVVDKNDHTVIIKQILLPSSDFNLDFQLDLIPKDLPKTSCGPYIISAIALDANFGTSQPFTVPDFEIPRHPSPGSMNLSLPKLDTSENSDVVKVNWKPPHSSDSGTEPENDYSFKVKVIGTCAKEAKHVKEDLDSADFKNIAKPDFIFPIPISPLPTQEDHELYECTFSLKELFAQNGIPCGSGVTLQCEVITVGECPKAAKLPSMPKSAEFIVVASPSKVKVSVSDIPDPGLVVSWPYMSHAVSYQIEVVNKKTKDVPLFKVHHYDNKESSVFDGFDTDVLLSMNDFKCVSSPSTYNLQMYSHGFGEELLRSLAPTVATEELHVIPTELGYLPESDTILVKFNLGLANSCYTLVLYQWDDEINLFLTRSRIKLQSQPGQLVKQYFHSEDWRPSPRLLQCGCIISAWVHSTVPNTPLYVGVSSNALQFLPSPHSITCAVTQMCESNCAIKEILLTWPKVTREQCYQYGFRNIKTGAVIFHKETHENRATIDFSTLQFPHLNYLHMECYVKSVGSADILITSNPVTDVTTYQRITSNKLTVVFTATLLHKLWSWHLAAAASRNCLLVPKLRQIMFPHGSPFPNSSIPSRIRKKFWKPELPLEDGCFAGTFSAGGYLYACDLLEGTDPDKWKEINPFANVKPMSWHSEVYLLLCIRCSKSPGKRVESTGKLTYELKVKTKRGKAQNVANAGAEHPETVTSVFTIRREGEAPEDDDELQQAQNSHRQLTEDYTREPTTDSNVHIKESIGSTLEKTGETTASKDENKAKFCSKEAESETKGGWLKQLKEKATEFVAEKAQRIKKWIAPDSKETVVAISKTITVTTRARDTSDTTKTVVRIIRHIKLKKCQSMSISLNIASKHECRCDKAHLFMRIV